MKIFYVKFDRNKQKIFSNIELRKFQSEIGQILVDYVGKNFYNLPDTSIIKENSKPKFVNSDIQFSISHSNEIVAVAFDNFPLGLDIEYMKDRDFKKISGHYGLAATEKIGFYKQWTQLEAKIKIQAEIKNSYTHTFEEKYMLTVVSSNPNDFTIEFISLDYPFS